jgi:Protein of unknown function (DUF2934)
MATRRTSEPTRSPKAAAPARAKSPSTPSASPAASAAPPGKPEPAQTTSPPPPEAAAASMEKPSAAKRAAKPKAAPPRAQVSPEMRRAMIAESAYLRAERRGFMGGNEADDWCAAEREVDSLLSAGTSAAAPQ